MPYTARQLAGLEALGVTPWILRESLQTGATKTAVTQSATSELETISAPENLGSWLLSQPVAQFKFRGKSLELLGREDAEVLLVMPSLPLSETAGRLLNDMLRSINLDPRSTCMVALGEGSLLPESTLTHRVHAGTRAVLFFSTPHISNDMRADHYFELPSAHGFCLPELHTLQQTPQLKRQAWNSLKALQDRLGR
ncbi:MAG: DNA polymerase III subunit psi [Gammaproteobacteria bacterium]|nr:DNA polymerase III subunit psi [Gammaproteobacteria bacterium]